MLKFVLHCFVLLRKGSSLGKQDLDSCFSLIDPTRMRLKFLFFRWSLNLGRGPGFVPTPRHAISFFFFVGSLLISHVGCQFNPYSLFFYRYLLMRFVYVKFTENNKKEKFDTSSICRLISHFCTN